MDWAQTGNAGSVLLNRAPVFETVVGTIVLRDDLCRPGQISIIHANRDLRCNICGIRSCWKLSCVQMKIAEHLVVVFSPLDQLWVKHCKVACVFVSYGLKVSLRSRTPDQIMLTVIPAWRMTELWPRRRSIYSLLLIWAKFTAKEMPTQTAT